MLDWFILGILGINTIILIYIAAFLVNTRKLQGEFYFDLLNLMEIPQVPLPPEDSSKKTWDERYEEEMEEYVKKLRPDSGLKDLSDKNN